MALEILSKWGHQLEEETTNFKNNALSPPFLVMANDENVKKCWTCLDMDGLSHLFTFLINRFQWWFPRNTSSHIPIFQCPSRFLGVKTHYHLPPKPGPATRTSDVQVRLDFSNLEILTLDDLKLHWAFRLHLIVRSDCSDWTHFFSDKN